MKPTQKYLEERHGHWLRLIAEKGIWDGTRFGAVEIKLRPKSRRNNGLYKRRIILLKNGTLTEKHQLIVYNNYSDYDPIFLDSILVHEMIHQYIAQASLKDTRSHGPLFRDFMRRINTVFSGSLNIEISHRGIKDDNVIRADSSYCLLYLQLPAQCYCCVVNPKSKDYFTRMLKRKARALGVTAWSWCVSSDTFFEGYVRCTRTLHGIKMPCPEWEAFKVSHGIAEQQCHHLK